MSEIAHETLERHEHLKHNPGDGLAKRAALAIGVLAAVLALFEMGERGSQNAYLAHNISASNEYAFYQARQTRALILMQSATLLNAQSPTPDTQKAAATAQAEAARLTEDSERGNGARQIQARAASETEQRDVALHKYEMFELVTSALEIAIVLASVSVVTQLGGVLIAGIAIGAATAAFGALVATGIV